MPDDPQRLIDESPMSRFQWWVVAILVGLNALDGFDVLSISFASPGISAAWGVDRTVLGIVLSMELIGMAAGSLILGGLADQVGRRTVMLGCLVLMAAGMFSASASWDVTSLSLCRVVTGLGVGGMLAATNAAAAETGNAARRSFAVSLMAGGYPVGAIIGGSICAVLLRHHGWPIVFQFGGVVTLLFIPLVLWRVPETVAFLADRRPDGALARINHALARMGKPAIAALAPRRADRPRIPLSRLFERTLRLPTVLLTLAYLGHIMTFYFILKWIPKIVVDMGFPASSAASVLVWANVGGVCGSVMFAVLATRLRLLPLAGSVMLVAAIAVILFGQGQKDLAQLSLVAAATGAFTNAGVVALYALVARCFPADVRASATGFIIGIGRGGSALAPACAGLLFGLGYALPGVALVMSAGSLVAGAAIFLLAARQRGAAERA
ncbi:MFS transporter [Sphingomonas elodea]|uniref:MFS transporter n=1 Tax=Sphingomonas elodea TaxID=179878 RepID=UPI0002631396|nr:MFS transporter [Sphingomonas elodea]